VWVCGDWDPPWRRRIILIEQETTIVLVIVWTC